MRACLAVFAFVLFAVSVQANELRTFDLKTTEQLGKKLYNERKQTADDLNPREKLALENAKAALAGQIDPGCKFIVVRDPVQKGYLVYAIASSDEPNDVVFGGHYRVTVSREADKVEAVEPLTKGANIVSKNEDGKETKALWTMCLVSNTPLETHVYLSLLHEMPLFVGTADKTFWQIQNGTITKTKGGPAPAGTEKRER